MTKTQKALLQEAFEKLGSGARYGRSLVESGEPLHVVLAHVDDVKRLVTTIGECVENAIGAGSVLEKMQAIIREEVAKLPSCPRMDAGLSGPQLTNCDCEKHRMERTLLGSLRGEAP